jgi:drug/metabolite transporter (DMT)-like permease
LKLTTGAVLVGATLFGLSSFLEGSLKTLMTVPPIVWFCALYLGAGSTFVGFVLYYWGIKNLGATRTGIFLNLVPVFGTVFSVLVFGEDIYWTYLVGLLLVVVGVIMINFPERKAEPAVSVSPIETRFQG